MTPHALTVDAGVRDLRAADHLLHGLAAVLDLPDAVFGCTHLVRGERPCVVVSLALPSGPLLSTVEERLAAHGHPVTRGIPDAVGRAVLYPGAASLTGTLTVADVVARSAIDRVTVLGAPHPPTTDTRLVTNGHVRPRWTDDGDLVLSAMPAAGGVLVPFEMPDPTPCCADH
ncbi:MULTISPECIES: hypothetical protein [Streptomyces]|uniref:Uncharacterized protein n=2 Tax=Streptomyces TaxID=1883 RepID=A0ABU4KJI1_9ACTN|nr:hypothetical protein [Streptomyces roseolus]MDX2297482.1 hypothetical protein [Streptomyces roseolus]